MKRSTLFLLCAFVLLCSTGCNTEEADFTATYNTGTKAVNVELIASAADEIVTVGGSVDGGEVTEGEDETRSEGASEETTASSESAGTETTASVDPTEETTTVSEGASEETTDVADGEDEVGEGTGDPEESDDGADEGEDTPDLATAAEENADEEGADAEASAEAEEGADAAEADEASVSDGEDDGEKTDEELIEEDEKAAEAAISRILDEVGSTGGRFSKNGRLDLDALIDDMTRSLSEAGGSLKVKDYVSELTNGKVVLEDCPLELAAIVDYLRRGNKTVWKRDEAAAAADDEADAPAEDTATADDDEADDTATAADDEAEGSDGLTATAGAAKDETDDEA